MSDTNGRPIMTITPGDAAPFRIGGMPVVIAQQTFLNVHRAEVTSLAARYRLPTVYPWRFYTKLGGLLSYGIDLPDNYRRAAINADRLGRALSRS